MKPHQIRILGLAVFLLPCIATAESPLISGTTASPSNPPPAAAEAEIKAGLPTPTPSPAPVPAEKPVPSPAVPAPPAPNPVAKGEIRLNFQNASLSDVLTYLSETAGFVVVQDTPVTGTVNIVSRQAINADEAVDLLNAVLSEKGYTAIRNNRILKIVSRTNAQKLDIPVIAGSDPAQIPRKDGVVTQILPVRYVEAIKLVENLRPLLSAEATISANEASNSILLADSQTNIHRIAEIIHALDTSVASISTLRVFQLQYADSKSLASVLTQLFSSDSTRGGNNQQQNFGGRGGRFAFPGFPGMPGMGGGAANTNANQNQAQQAATKVVAVADEQSNSVIVSAPDALMASIADIVSRIDTNISDVTENRIFKLQFADSTEIANILTSLYSDTTSTPAPRNNGNPFFGQQQPDPSSQSSKRSLLQSRVVAVPDPRTNSLVVSAARDTMAEIALTIGRLDANDAKKQHVYIHRLENADPDNVAAILRGMFSSQNTSPSDAQPSASRLNQRTTNGASSDVTNMLNTSTSR